jgi:hypothetical protein
LTVAHHPYPAGTRVRHSGHQFPRAYTEGTATVVGHKLVGYVSPFVEWVDRLEYEVDVDQNAPVLTGGQRVWWSGLTTHSIDEEE